MRLYDARLARAGLTATQFSLMRALLRDGKPVPLSRLATGQVLERTSLYRALEPLQREGLVKLGTAASGRGKAAALTPSGRRRIDRALPYWREAQTALLGFFGDAAWARMVPRLQAMVVAAQRVTSRGDEGRRR